jgi:photosystem II stability/assembly factor-like uncharacterized protein
MPNVQDTLLLTKNGGKTWEMNAFANNSYTSVNKSTTTQSGLAYIFGKSKVFRSDDFGQTWAPQDGLSLDGYIEAVDDDTLFHFTTKKQGLFLSYFAIDKSVDKGVTWQEVVVNPTGLPSKLSKDHTKIQNVHFLNSKYFYITSTDDDVVSVTQDGGLTFKQIFGATNQKATDAYFKDAQNGIIISEYGPYAYVTSDGGDSFNEVILENFKTDTDSKIESLGNDNLIIFSHLNSNFLTSDFGATWESFGKNLISTSSMRILDVKFWNENDIKAAYSIVRNNDIEEAGILKSNDGGASWNAINDKLYFSYNQRNTIHLVSPDTIYFVEGNSFRLSTDSGKTFSNNYILDPIYGTPAVLHAFDPENFILVYSNDQVFLSENAGSSWSSINLIHGGGHIKSLVGINNSEAYALADSKLLRLKDKGRKFKEITSNINFSDTRDIFLLKDTSTLLITGINGVVWRSEDRGSTWSDIQENMPESIKYNDWIKLVQRNDSILYLIAHDKIAKSSDKGKTWNEDNSLYGSFAMDWNKDNAIAMNTFGSAYRWYKNNTDGFPTFLAGPPTNDKNIVFYPNPVTDGLIRFTRPSTVVLYDINGHVCASAKEKTVLDISSLEPGIYLLRIQNGITQKVIIQ